MRNVKSTTSRAISLLLALILACAALPVPALAKVADEEMGEEKPSAEMSEPSDGLSLSDEELRSQSQELTVDSRDTELSEQSVVASGTLGGCTWSLNDAGC